MDGSIISGDVFPESSEFVLKKVKNFETESVLSIEKINAIYDYLSRASHYDDFHIVTINEQFPIKLNNDEVQAILRDLDQVRKSLNT